MSEEILNIDYHVKQLVLKALKRAATHQEAAKLLGITVRSLCNYKYRFNIKTGKLPFEVFVNKKAA